MYVPKHWLFLFGLSCTFGVALLWLYTQNALLNAEVSSLERDVVALEVDANSLAGDVRQLEFAVAELQSASDSAVATGTAAARHGIASLADETLESDTSVVVAELQAIASELRAAQTPQVVVVDTSTDDACLFADGDEHAAQGGGGSSGGGSFEASIEANNEIGNYATNSGNIIDSFFLDGGQGDVGLNIVESVLNGVNISIVHQSGENSLSDSANNMAGPVTGNNPTNEHSPSFSGNEISAPVSVSGTVDSSNAIGGNDAASATLDPPVSDAPVAVAPQTVTLNGAWTMATDEPTSEEATADESSDAPGPVAIEQPAPVDMAPNVGSESSNPGQDADTVVQSVDVERSTTPTPAPVEPQSAPASSDHEAAETPSDE
ncbi:MAG: hypothetical protein AAGA42_13145 [Actinomycetota bacterium]